MKIAMPVDEKSLESTVCMSFGRAPYFLIFDTETKQSEFMDNSAAASQGGAGIKAAQSLVDAKAYALLTPRCGQNAVDVLKAADIKVYRTKGESIKDNIDSYIKGSLDVLEQAHPGFHGHGG